CSICNCSKMVFKLVYKANIGSFDRMVEQIEKEAIRSDSKEFRLYPGVYKNLHDKLVAFVEKGLQQNEHSKIYNNKTKRWRIVKDTSNPSNVILIMNIPAKNNKPARA
ncbi:unnamed protein product, partial [Didymodactylos carnosus]